MQYHDALLMGRVCRQLVDWKVCSREVNGIAFDRLLLSRLLGYPHILEMNAHFSEDDRLKCEKLLGRHGWTIYKAMKARMQHD